MSAVDTVYVLTPAQVLETHTKACQDRALSMSARSLPTGGDITSAETTALKVRGAGRLLHSGRLPCICLDD